MSQLCQRIAESNYFHNLILGVIVAAGVLVGLETYPALTKRYGAAFHFLDQAILWIFTIEIAIKFIARGRQWWRFFLDPWNVFDFIIVAVCFLPIGSQYAAVLRLVRVLRVLRLISNVPKLQILVGALLKSIPSMGYVGLLLLLHFYIYAVLGTSLFGKNDPIHFGTLSTAMLTLFQVVTLEGWIDIFKIQHAGSANFGYEGHEHLIVQSDAFPVASVLYFVSFILLGTMIMLNLLIGVIMNGMQESQAETTLADREKRKKSGQISLSDEIGLAERQIEELKRQLQIVRARAGRE